MIPVAATEKADHACGLAVVAAPEPDKLKFFRNRFGETEGRFDSFRAAGKELDVGDACRQQIADELEEPGAGLGREAAEGGARELLADALDVMGMAVADAADRYAGN